MGEYNEELYRMAVALEKIANNPQRIDALPSSPTDQLVVTQKIFIGTCLGAAQCITDVLNDSSLNVIKKHTELRKLVQRLEDTALRVEQDMNPHEMGKLPHSFDV